MDPDWSRLGTTRWERLLLRGAQKSQGTAGTALIVVGTLGACLSLVDVVVNGDVESLAACAAFFLLAMITVDRRIFWKLLQRQALEIEDLRRQR